MKILIQYLKPYKLLVILVLVLAAINIGFSLVDPIIFGKLINLANYHQSLFNNPEAPTWNEFLFALLLTGVDTRTVPVAMNQAVSSGGRGTDWTLLASIETLFLIPVFLVTFFLQNHLLRGVTFGTVKR